MFRALSNAPRRQPRRGFFGAETMETKRSCYRCRAFLVCHARHRLWDVTLELVGWIEPARGSALFDALAHSCRLFTPGEPLVMSEADRAKKEPGQEPGKSAGNEETAER